MHNRFTGVKACMNNKTDTTNAKRGSTISSKCYTEEGRTQCQSAGEHEEKEMVSGEFRAFIFMPYSWNWCVLAFWLGYLVLHLLCGTDRCMKQTVHFDSRTMRTWQKSRKKIPLSCKLTRSILLEQNVSKQNERPTWQTHFSVDRESPKLWSNSKMILRENFSREIKIQNEIPFQRKMLVFI